MDSYLSSEKRFASHVSILSNMICFVFHWIGSLFWFSAVRLAIEERLN